MVIYSYYDHSTFLLHNHSLFFHINDITEKDIVRQIKILLSNNGFDDEKLLIGKAPANLIQYTKLNNIRIKHPNNMPVFQCFDFHIFRKEFPG